MSACIRDALQIFRPSHSLPLSPTFTPLRSFLFPCCRCFNFMIPSFIESEAVNSQSVEASNIPRRMHARCFSRVTASRRSGEASLRRNGEIRTASERTGNNSATTSIHDGKFPVSLSSFSVSIARP